MIIKLLLASLFLLTFCSQVVLGQDSLELRTCVQGFPDYISSRLVERDRRISGALQNLLNRNKPFLVLDRLGKWRPAQTITVAFKGGSYQLRNNIATVAESWTQHANLVLDFGHNHQDQSFREWSLQDASYSADIRIAFDEIGYWSVVGSDSSNPSIVLPSEPSMSLQLFDVYLPPDWEGTVLHEFGHALGFEHEHQHPAEGCDSEFKWYDDFGYIDTVDSSGKYTPDNSGNFPGIYKVLAGSPNNWSRTKVDFNLKQLSNSRAFGLVEFDANSIMKYFFETWMFVRGANSVCYTPRRANTLSVGDIQGAMLAYPQDLQRINSIISDKQYILDTLSTLPDISSELEDELRFHTETLTLQ